VIYIIILIKGGISYVLMITSGASVGAKYKDRVYFDCIQIIAKAIADNQEFLKLTNYEACEKLIRLVSFILPNENEVKLFLISLKSLDGENNSVVDAKTAFDNLRKNCYKAITV
jgi:hypothetical protein